MQPQIDLVFPPNMVKRCHLSTQRFLMRCELDAACFHLYGIERDDVDYIIETFPIVKCKDEAKYKVKVLPGDPRYPEDLSKYEVGDDGSVEVGDYRTKRVILEIYDAMQHAIDTGTPYQTLLDPPPADPSVAHPTESNTRKEDS